MPSQLPMRRWAGSSWTRGPSRSWARVAAANSGLCQVACMNTPCWTSVTTAVEEPNRLPESGPFPMADSIRIRPSNLREPDSLPSPSLGLGRPLRAGGALGACLPRAALHGCAVSLCRWAILSLPPSGRRPILAWTVRFSRGESDGLDAQSRSLEAGQSGGL